MNNSGLPENVINAFNKMAGEMKANVTVPPPVFEAMKGEFLRFDEENGTLECRFPVLREQLNPYGTMQGGMIAAAVDNTLGPLSMLTAPPNFTRNLEIKYRKTIVPENGHVWVTGKIKNRDGRWLNLTASVHDSKGTEYAFAKAKHWIFGGDE